MEHSIANGISKRESYPKWLNNFKLNEYEKKLKELESKTSQMKNEINVANKTVNSIKDQKSNNPKASNISNDDMSIKNNDTFKDKYIKSMGMVKQLKAYVDNTTSNIDGRIGITKRATKFMQENLRKSHKSSNYIKTKFSVQAGNLAENMVNFTGRMTGKNFSEYANAAKQLTNAGTKKILLGTTSAKQATKLRRNKITKKVLDTVGPKKISSMYGKFKKGTEKIFNWSLDDSTSLISKGIKKVSHPQLAGLMKKAGNLKLSGVMKKTAGTKIGQAFMKSFSIGNAMNVHSIMTEKSDFKKLLAGTDIAGSFVSKLPGPVSKAIGLGASTLNFAGGLAYDFFDSKFMERFGGKKVTKVLDKGAGFIVKPVATAIKTTQKAWSSMKKTAKAIKQKGLRSSLKAGMSLVKNKTPQPIKNALKGYANMYLHPIQTWKKAGTFLVNKSKDMFKKPKLKDYNDIYYKNLALSKNKQHAINHNGEVVQTKLQGGQIDNLGKNNFTININGTNKSTQEIMNEIVPEIKLRMKNISVA